MSAAGQPDYIVSTRYEVEDASTRAMQRIRGETVDLQKSTRNLQLGIAGLTAAYFAARGAMNSFLGLKSKLIDYNENIRASTVGLAAMLTGSAKFEGVTSAQAKFFQAMKMAPSIVDDLRKTAAAGIGELRDYMGGFNILVVPLMQAGLKAKNIVEITKLLVPISKTLRYDMMFASMDVQQMVLGRATLADRLPKYLGLSVHEMNKLARSTDGAAKVIKVVTEKLRTWAPAAEQFGRSFTAQSDTLKDTISELWGRAGESLTAAATKALLKVNEYLAANRKKIDAFLGTSGAKLADTFERTFNFVFETTQEIARHWDTIYETGKKLLQVYLAIKAAHLAIAAKNVAVGLVQTAGGLASGVGAAARFINAGQAWGGVSSGLAAMGAGANVPASVAAAMQARLGPQGNAATAKLGSFALALGKSETAADKFSKGLFTAGAAVAAAGLGYALGKFADEALGLSDKLAEGFRFLVTGEWSHKTQEEREEEERFLSRKAPQAYLAYLAERTKEGISGSPFGEESPSLYSREASAVALRRMSFEKMIPVQQQDVRVVAAEFATMIKDETILSLAGEMKNPEKFLSMAERFSRTMIETPGYYGLPEGFLTMAHHQAIWGGGKDVEGVKSKINNDFRGSKFEVKVDARDKDPDAIAFVFSEMVHKQVEFQTRSSLAPPLSP